MGYDDDERAYADIIRENSSLDILMDRYPCDRDFLQGVYDLKNGAVERIPLTPPDARTMIRSVSVSSNGTRLARFSDSEPRDPGTDALVLWTEP